GAIVDAYASTLKTETVRNELRRLEALWMHATTDIDRARIARDAELLADRTEENLPGAPQDRARTNLRPGEQASATPATSFDATADERARELMSRAKHLFDSAADG